MNTLVLAIAGVFVLAGLVLILLSFLVGRVRTPADVPDAEPASAGTSGDEGAFIDQPLVTDLATQLAGRKKSAESAESGAMSSSDGSSAEQPAAAARADAEDDAVGTEVRANTKPTDGTTAIGAAAVPGDTEDQVGFDLRVQLGFKLLTDGLHEDGVAELGRALALTNDPETKLRLYIEIGNAFRAQQMPGPAGAAYLQVTSYTDNPALLEQLKRAVAEMMELNDVGVAEGVSAQRGRSD